MMKSPAMSSPIAALPPETSAILPSRIDTDPVSTSSASTIRAFFKTVSAVISGGLSLLARPQLVVCLHGERRTGLALDEQGQSIDGGRFIQHRPKKFFYRGADPRAFVRRHSASEGH